MSTATIATPTAAQPAAPGPAAALTREQVVTRILEINRSASTAFLGRFDDGGLRAYLEHLMLASAPRGASWVRPGDTPAIVGRESRD